MPLRIDLKAGETFILNDSTMYLNKSAALIIESRATFIRTRDLVQESDIKTIAERIYFLCQQIYLSESRYKTLYPLVRRACADFLEAAPGFGPSLLQLETRLAQAEFYKAMKLAHEMVGLESDPLHVYF